MKFFTFFSAFLVLVFFSAFIPVKNNSGKQLQKSYHPTITIGHKLPEKPKDQFKGQWKASFASLIILKKGTPDKTLKLDASGDKYIHFTFEDKEYTIDADLGKGEITETGKYKLKGDEISLKAKEGNFLRTVVKHYTSSDDLSNYISSLTRDMKYSFVDKDLFMTKKKMVSVRKGVEIRLTYQLSPMED